MASSLPGPDDMAPPELYREITEPTMAPQLKEGNVQHLIARMERVEDGIIPDGISEQLSDHAAERDQHPEHHTDPQSQPPEPRSIHYDIHQDTQYETRHDIHYDTQHDIQHDDVSNQSSTPPLSVQSPAAPPPINDLLAKDIAPLSSPEKQDPKITKLSVEEVIARLAQSDDPHAGDASSVVSTDELSSAADRETAVIRVLQGKSTSELRRSIGLVVKLMQTNLNSEATQESCFRVIGRAAQLSPRMSSKPDPAPSAEQVVGMRRTTAEVVCDVAGRQIITSMTYLRTSGLLQKLGIAVLLALTATDDSRKLILQMDGDRTVVNAMERFPMNEAVQVDGATTLSNLAFGAESKKDHIRLAGGIDAIIKSMRRHQENPEVQAKCVLALRNLTFKSQKNQIHAGNAEAVEAILHAMVLFSDSEAVQYQGCVALSNLSSMTPENARRIVDQGGIVTTVRAMRRKPEHAGFQEHGCSVLGSLAENNAQVQEDIGDESGIQTILAAMQAHSNNVKVVEKGSRVMCNVVALPANQDRLYLCGGLDILLDILKTSAKNSRAVTAILKSLTSSIRGCSRNRLAMTAYGGVRLVIASMRELPRHTDVQLAGIEILTELVRDNLENRKTALSYGAREIVIAAMRRIRGSREVQESGIAFLVIIGADTNVPLDEKKKTIDRSTAVIRENTEDENFVRRSLDLHRAVPKTQPAATSTGEESGPQLTRTKSVKSKIGGPSRIPRAGTQIERPSASVPVEPRKGRPHPLFGRLKKLGRKESKGSGAVE